MFDLDALVAQTTQAEGVTILPMPDEGDYRAMIDNANPVKEWFRQLKVKNKDTGDEEDRLILRVPFLLQDPSVIAKMKRDRVIVSADLWVDLLPNGRLDLETEGKNMRIHRLRAAVNQNRKGVTWSPAMLAGAGPLLVHVTKRPNPKGGDDFTEVDRFTAIA
jgi:hypothetical protein